MKPPRLLARLSLTAPLVCLALLVCSARPALADDGLTIKLGTLAPVGSSWHVLLKEFGEKMADVSGGKVKLRIYAGGTQGAEGDMVRKMGVGQLQAASISNIGLHDIAPEAMVFSAPGMVDEALTRELLPKVAPRMESALEARGYVVLMWAQIGAAYVFCKKAYTTPDQASEAKFFAWDGDPGSVEAFKLMGVKPVVLASTDIMPSLETGMISCVSQAPAYVLTTRLFEKANHMVDYPLAYMIGATVVKKEVWEKVPADLRPKLLALAREAGAKVDAEVKRLNADAIIAMKKQGLDVITVDPVPWEKASQRAWPAVRGKVVPTEFFDLFVKLRDEARAEAKRAAAAPVEPTTPAPTPAP
jgi:TRAP-type C4-dicarboxylate transport system substrate-binding protein